jgi:hypothetical protein
MFETAGTLAIVELTSSLAALVLLPLLWAAVCGLSAVRGTDGRVAMRVAIAASGGTLGLAIAHALRATQAPPGHIAQQHIATLARIGQLDIALDLVRSPTSAACALLAALVAFAAVLHSIWTAPARIAARLAWTGLATSAIFLVALSDGLPTLVLGLQVATLAGWALAGGGRSRLLVLALAGDITVVFAVWILFWSLGGTFGTSGYTPDSLPRFAIVAVPSVAPAPSPARGSEKASVSLTSYDDATVSSDDGPPLPGEPIRAPFTVALDPGVYSFRIQAGAATMDMLVTHVTLAPGRSYVLMPYGPTTSMSNLDAQLLVPRPTLGGASSMRAVLASRFMSGVHVTSMVGLLVVLAALLRLGLLAKTQQGGLVYALEAIPPLVLGLHVAPLLEPGIGPALAIASAVAAVFLAGDAAASRSSDRVPRALLGALAAFALTSALLGEAGGAMVIVFTASLGAASATAALDAEADVRWLGVACASLAGVMPGAGASPGIVSTIAGAFAASSTGHTIGALVAPLVAIAAILVALAAFRVFDASIRSPLTVQGPHGPRVLALVLAAASLLGGALLGVGSSPFGGKTLPFARRLVDAPGGLDDNPRIAVAALGLAVAAAFVGLVAARYVTQTSQPPLWLAALGGPAALMARASRAVSSVVRFFVRSVVIMNEDVIDDVTEVVASTFAALGQLLRRLDANVGTGLVARTLGRGADQVVVGTGMDDPRRFERVRNALVLGMVAILGLIVLSSIVLG